MPTPQSTFFRPNSLSQGGTCKLNLRGNSFYDYANENTVWTQSGTIVKSSVVEQTSWTYFIPKNYLFDVANTLTRDTLLTTSITNFTLMFRFYVTSLEEPGATGISIFFNGTPMAGGFWGVYVFGGSAASLNFSFIFSRGARPESQTISTEAIAQNTWYHVAVTLENNGDGTSTFFGYLNGFKTGNNLTFADMDAVSGNTTLGNNGMGQSQAFQLTDIVFLEKVLTAGEIKGYASSAFI
jgi:hypothetical protein